MPAPASSIPSKSFRLPESAQLDFRSQQREQRDDRDASDFRLQTGNAKRFRVFDQKYLITNMSYLKYVFALLSATAVLLHASAVKPCTHDCYYGGCAFEGCRRIDCTGGSCDMRNCLACSCSGTHAFIHASLTLHPRFLDASLALHDVA